MYTPSQRIKELIEALNLNINSFSKECGYPSSATIWRLINDGAKPSSTTLNKICNRFPQVNREWLMTGLGSMFNTPALNEDDLTLTAKQVLDRLLPIMPDKNLVDTAMATLRDFLKDYAEMKQYASHFQEQWQKGVEDSEKYYAKMGKLQNDLSIIKDKITAITMMKGFEFIKNEEQKKPKSNGNGNGSKNH